MKRLCEDVPNVELPLEVWILIGKSLCLPPSEELLDEEDYQTLSRFVQTCNTIKNIKELSHILSEWKKEVICVICQIKKGQIHSNCLCLFRDNEKRLNALCLICSKGKCDYCGYGNCGCHEMENSCMKCSSLFCQYCQGDYNALKLDDWPIVCSSCHISL